jgi:hypothetical protein
MSEDGYDDAVVVQGDVGETMQAEERKEAEKKQEGQQQEEKRGEEGKELQADDELKQRVVARQEEKGKGELSLVSEEEGEDTDSKLLASQQQRKRIKKNGKKGPISKQKEQQPTVYDLSKQLENHAKQLSRMGNIIQQLPKYLKNADTQSRIIKQINSSMNQLQRQIGKIQKSVQKKSKQQK